MIQLRNTTKKYKNKLKIKKIYKIMKKKEVASFNVPIRHIETYSQF